MKPCVKTPCPHCAFTRSSTPGELGGSAPEVYIGQAHGPFYVPCHMQYGDRKDIAQVKAECEQIHQCAGMAIFRANLGVDAILPPQIARLPADRELVFGSAVEFLSHHKGISLYRAAQELTVTPPIAHLKRELSKAELRMIPLKEEQ